VRRERPLVHSGVTPPGNWFAPPGSNQSSSGGNETAEASGAEGRYGDSGEHAGRNVSETLSRPRKRTNARSRPAPIMGKGRSGGNRMSEQIPSDLPGIGDGMQAKRGDHA